MASRQEKQAIKDFIGQIADPQPDEPRQEMCPVCMKEYWNKTAYKQHLMGHTRLQRIEHGLPEEIL